jgi:hypothetical protein
MKFSCDCSCKAIQIKNSQSIRKIGLKHLSPLDSAATDLESTSDLIFRHCPHSSIYSILKVGSEPFPVLSLNFPTNKRLISLFWEMMDNNAKNKTPWTKIPIKKIEISPPLKPLFTNLDEIQNWAIQIVDNYSTIIEEAKRRSMSLCIPGLSNVHLSLFFTIIDPDLTKLFNTQPIEDLPEYFIYGYPLQEDFKEEISNSFSIAQNDWQRVFLKDHSNISTMKSEEEWVLLFKKMINAHEKKPLIDIFSCSIGLSQHIICTTSISDPDSLYLWIRKSAYLHAMVAFKFKIANSSE